MQKSLNQHSHNIHSSIVVEADIDLTTVYSLISKVHLIRMLATQMLYVDLLAESENLENL